jgi:flagellar biosynthesis/type III secretory pathway protein FliH
MAGARVGTTEATFGHRGPLTGQRRVVPLLDLPKAPKGGSLTTNDGGIEPLAPPLPPPPPQPGPEFAQRLAKAIADLRAQSVRIGEQAEADVVEIAAVIAERILEKELQAGTDALFSLVRSAVRRLGESRKIVVRLSPSDAAAVKAAGDGGPMRGLAIVKIDVIADATLSPGDCMVDGEHGSVDGKLSTRLDEVRRIVSAALAAPEEAP